ncbi:hypothetical protein LRAMOSA01240 [Lichtheimia ramosa]|uniref:Cyclin N-terminal domain-containing protein n=1 Tax=Lichtheimia ramosa TaxID=688394 RepID=A0A077WHN9_9FUNG|nr:hypothetical protein LRAMOSA01240 [Lichtheimia ramosa]
MVHAPCMKAIQDMPGVCLAIVSDLYSKHNNRQVPWDDARRLNFYNYCQYLTTYINVSPAVVYTSLHYIKRYLQSIDSCTRQKMLSVQGSEKSLFMAALLLAFKIVEDWGCVDMKYWSQISMLSVTELTRIEMDFLCQVNHRLHVNKFDFVRWVTRCNSIFEQWMYYVTTQQDKMATSQQYPCYVSPATQWYPSQYQDSYYTSYWNHYNNQLYHRQQQQQQQALESYHDSSYCRKRNSRRRRNMTTGRHYHYPSWQPQPWHWAAAAPLAPSLTQ